MKIRLVILDINPTPRTRGYLIRVSGRDNIISENQKLEHYLVPCFCKNQFSSPWFFWWLNVHSIVGQLALCIMCLSNNWDGVSIAWKPLHTNIILAVFLKNSRSRSSWPSWCFFFFFFRETSVHLFSADMITEKQIY